MQTNRVELTSKTYDVDDFAAAQEFYHSNGWTDGLPVVPPTETAVEACLEWALMPPTTSLGSTRFANSGSRPRSSPSTLSCRAACQCTFPSSRPRGRP